MPILYPDATTESADWIKPTSDDLRLTVEEINLMTIEDLEATMALPSWAQASTPVQNRAAERLAATAD